MANVTDTPAVDLRHLRSMTLGDEVLEEEVLALFAEQAGRTVAAIVAPGAKAPRQDAAHRLKGAARAVGAFDLAAAADAVEAADALTPKAARALSDALTRVLEFLAQRRAR